MSFKPALQSLLRQSLAALAAAPPEYIGVERARESRHGDFASNIAMQLAKPMQQSPRALAEKIVQSLPACDWLAKTEIAGPGFINFYLQESAYRELIDAIRTQGENYGRVDAGQGARVLVEFVSANPTGPLHVGHGRGAAYGDSLARVLRAAGFQAQSEYYLNDAGRQMDILALSVWLRYLQKCGAPGAEAFPANLYQGAYISDIAQTLHAEVGDDLNLAGDLFADLPREDEAMLDELIARCKTKLGDAYATLFAHGRDALVDDIRRDLREFGVTFDRWFSEHEDLHESGAVEVALAALKKNQCVYVADGAEWFRAQKFGDEKDRVVKRANGAHTYFAADIAYHFNKGERGFDKLLNIFGADHHGYAPRIKAALEAFGHARDKLEVLLVQFAVLHRGGEKVSMSTRGGEFVSLRELREEVGNDAARFFYVLRRPDQHLDFDLDLAKTQSADNPVYYIQYAHARICSVFAQVREKNLPTPDQAAPDYAQLTEARELELMRELSRFPEVVEAAALAYEPHQVAYYLRELAAAFHAYYNAHPFVASENNLRLARLGLIDAVRIVIANGLTLLGVSAPESM